MVSSHMKFSECRQLYSLGKDREVVVVCYLMIAMYRVIQILYMAADSCRSRPFLADPLPDGASYCCCLQTLTDVTRAQLEFYMASVSVILLLFVQTAQILQFPVINVLEIFGGYVLISCQSI